MAEFAIQFLCRNCGEVFEKTFSEGTRVQEEVTSGPRYGPEGITGKIERGQSERIKCVTCNSHENLTIDERLGAVTNNEQEQEN